MKTILGVAASAMILLSNFSIAEEYNHFPSLPSKDISTAMCNIKTYNQKLDTIMAQKELSAQDMVKVHELTYTLENALIFLKEVINKAAVDLERVHKASEALDPKTIKQSGNEYLQATDLLVAEKECK